MRWELMFSASSEISGMLADEAGYRSMSATKNNGMTLL